EGFSPHDDSICQRPNDATEALCAIAARQPSPGRFTASLTEHGCRIDEGLHSEAFVWCGYELLSVLPGPQLLRPKSRDRRTGALVLNPVVHEKSKAVSILQRQLRS